jgi:hypothetical protein
MRMPPARLQRLPELLSNGEQLRARERPSRMRERQQHERLIVQVGARVEDDALMVEAVDVEAVGATTPLDEKIDIGVDHLPPGTGPPEPAEFTIGEDVPGLHGQCTIPSTSGKVKDQRELKHSTRDKTHFGPREPFPLESWARCSISRWRDWRTVGDCAGQEGLAYRGTK